MTADAGGMYPVPAKIEDDGKLRYLTNEFGHLIDAAYATHGRARR